MENENYITTMDSVNTNDESLSQEKAETKAAALTESEADTSIMAKNMAIVLGLGFSGLAMSMLTIMGIKSTLGILNVVHDNLFVFSLISISLIAATLIADNKLMKGF